MGNIHWLQVGIGYLIGSFFGLFALMGWVKGITGGKTAKTS
jgi:hypothetical protein